MRSVPTSMINGYEAELKTGGAGKPTIRATIQKLAIRLWDYDTANAGGGSMDTALDRHTKGQFASAIFGNPNTVIELRQIKSCNWTRSLDQDVAECTMVLHNAEILPVGQSGQDVDREGWFTPGRGKTSNPWGHTKTGWQDLLVPDNIVRTYEGYGINPDVPADQDAHLVQSGMWLIDSVEVDAGGNSITLTMRDTGRLLLDHIVFPPVVPFSEYPLTWSKFQTVQVMGRDATGGRWRQLTGRASARSSNDYYVGRGMTNGGVQYVDSRGGVYGHHAADALNDTNTTKTYWLSTGQVDEQDFVWWQADLNDHTTALNGLRIRTLHANYVYISLKGKNGWIGQKKVPYEFDPDGDAGGVNVHADIPFVKKVRAEGGSTFDVILPRRYGDIRAIRLTFTMLRVESPRKPYPFNAGLHDVRIYTAPNVHQLGFARGPVMKTVGNYRDYVSVVKWACAWAGFYWPNEASGDDWQNTTAGRTYNHQFRQARIFPRGQAWGTFGLTGTGGVADLTPDLFDKKPLMDIVAYVRDLTGFNFWIDEVGSVVWRMPNIWGLGNYVWNLQRDYPLSRTSSFVTLEDDGTLLNYGTTLDSKNVRERIFVANSTGKVGTVIRGYSPTKNGMRRVVGWTDQHFATKRETIVMADMIAARTMFTYRRARSKIPGNPRIQVDDQVRIYERKTTETYFHYVLSVASSHDVDEGTWDYDLETHWLGVDPADAWVVKVDELKTETKQYLGLVGSGEE